MPKQTENMMNDLERKSAEKKLIILSLNLSIRTLIESIDYTFDAPAVARSLADAKKTNIVARRIIFKFSEDS